MPDDPDNKPAAIFKLRQYNVQTENVLERTRQ